MSSTVQSFTTIEETEIENIEIDTEDGKSYDDSSEKMFKITERIVNVEENEEILQFGNGLKLTFEYISKPVCLDNLIHSGNGVEINQNTDIVGKPLPKILIPVMELVNQKN